MTTVRVPDRGPKGNKASKLFSRGEQIEDLNASIRVARADLTRWETAADDAKLESAIAGYRKQIAAIEKEFEERKAAYLKKIADLLVDAAAADGKLAVAQRRLEQLKAKKDALKSGGAFDRLMKLKEEMGRIADGRGA